MRYLFAVILFLFAISVALSQDTIFLKGQYDQFPVSRDKAIYFKVIHKNVSPPEVELSYMNGVKVSKYHVDPSNLNIYQGEYESYYYNGGIQTKGIFKDDKMQGYWLVYNKDKNFVENKIFYKDDQKDGKSFTFREDGKLIQMELFIKNNLSETTCYDSTGSIIDCFHEDSLGIFESADVNPSFVGGVHDLMLFLQHTIRYPSDAREHGLEGKVIVKFYIDLDGSVKDIRILKDGVGGGCAQEALRVCSMMPKWIPASNKGKPVRMYFTLPITFKLS